MAIDQSDIVAAAKFNDIHITHTLAGTAAATAANYGKIYTAPYPVTVISMYEVHTTAGSDGGAVTLGLERLQGTEASGSGDDLLSAAMNLKSTAETPVKASLTATTALLTLQRGDRLNLVDTGTLTAVAGVSVTIVLRPVVE